MERRALYLPGKVEVRDVNGKPAFVGRAVQYNQWSELIYGHFQERILPGAFDQHLAGKPDVIACVDHDARKLLGRTSANTLNLLPDGDGIAVEVPQPETSYARDLAESIRRGDIRGMSFVFDVVTDNWHRENSVPSRDVSEARLYEVSFVIFPAYPQTTAGLRALPGSEEEREAVMGRMRAALVEPKLQTMAKKLRVIEADF